MKKGKRKVGKKYILLDWDGNLIQTLHVWLESVRAPLVARGFKLSDKEVASCFGPVESRFAELGITDVDVAVQELEAEARKRMPQASLYPDALPVLDGLIERRKKLALVTSNYRHIVEKLLEDYKLSGYFDVLVCENDIEQHKPHPEAVLKAMEELGASTEESIMIGDSPHDIVAAQRAGIESILFFPPEHKVFYNFEELRSLQPTHIVTDFQEVLGLV